VTALHGRTQELERLAKAADDARTGRGGTHLLCGEPGIGKTRLAEEVARHARDRGTRVVWGRAWEGGGAPPFWPWIQIARGLLKVGAVPPPELGRLSPDLAGPSGPSPLLASSADRFVLFDSMLRFVREAAGREPLLLVFDDLHAADAATVQMLGFIAPELRDERILVVGTFRDVEARLQPPIGDALAAVGRAGEVVRLQRLGRADVAAIAREHLALDEVDLDALFAKTEGNPLFVGETARVLATEGRSANGTLPLSDGVRAAIRAHLGRVPPERRHDLEIAAVIGREFAATVLAPLTDSPVSELVGRLSEAAAAGFLVERMPSRFAFAHGLFREVLLADLGPRAAAIHASIADRLEALHAGDPTALAEIARHWLSAGPDHAARAREAARGAAEGAVAALAYDEAADMLERALAAHEQAAPGDAKERAELLLDIGDARIRAGESRRGKDACERAAAIARSLGDTALLVRAALGHGRDFVAGARDRELAALLQEALAVVGSRTDLRARLLARLAAAQQPARDPREPIALAHEALALLKGIDEPSTRLAVLHNASGAMVDFSDPHERQGIDEEVARLAVSLGERAVHLRALGRLYHDHAERGDLAGAAVRLEDYEIAAQPWRQPHVRMPILLGRSCLALLRGRAEESAALVEQARELARRTRDPWLGLAVGMHEIASMRIRGRSEELVGRHGELRAMLDVFPDYAAGFDAMVAATRGDAEAARASLARLDREHVRVCMDTMLPTWVAEAAVVTSEPAWGELAEEVLEPLAAEWISWSGIAFVVETPVARARALAARARGDAAGAGVFFAEAIADAARAGAEAVVERLRKEAGRIPDAPVDPVRGLVTLTREGDYWAASGLGRKVLLKDSRGMHMLASLVAAPGRELHALDLSRLGEDGGAIDAGDAGEVLDRRAREAYRTRLAELTRERENAEIHHDPGRVARVQAEIDALAGELSRGVGLGGRARRSGRAAERARVNVQRRLAEAIRRIEEAHGPLGAHLRKAVRTGAFCSYAPERAERV
jgi:hypothetical protein